MVAELKGGFRTLWLRYDANCIGQHQLFCKEHSVRNQNADHPKGKTLFVINLPPWTSLCALKEAFSICGPVKAVMLPSGSGYSKPGFSTAYVVFEKESSLDKILSLPADTTLTLHDIEKPSAIGLTKWCNEYNATVLRDEQTAKKEIEEYMREYDERIAQRLARENGGDEEEVEGEDGWTTVTNKKKRGKFATVRKESTINKLQRKEERKSRKKELLNFYTFQIRESKKQNLVELRKKFELDKKKLEQLKSKRTFKPF